MNGRKVALKPIPHNLETFGKAADIIAEICGIERATILPSSHMMDDLGIDSLDVLDIAFAIDKSFGIKMPVENWTKEVNEGMVSSDHHFRMDGLCHHIDQLVAAKETAT